jgi:16S rRNA (guanine966-N2)-methyltransferase
VRIVAGLYGGRRIAAPPGTMTRPTSDRVREALFSMLGPLDDQVALDLFAGSGALGLEALSRGASRAVFVERDRRALATLRANVTTLGLSAERAWVRPGDAGRVARDAVARAEAYDLVFLDPPYRLAAGLGAALGVTLTGLLTPDARVVTESSERAPMALTLPITQERRYGDTLIRIHIAA